MKLAQLKQKVYEAWEFLNTYKGRVLQPENFKLEMLSFGDLRRKDTWVSALARFEALNAYHNCLDAYMLILNDFNFTRDRWDYEYRHQILDEFLMIPDALDLLELGLEQLLKEPFAPENRREASGFFELVEEQRSLLKLPTGPVWRLTGTYPARAS
ncbi:MAG TPA: hypothetical protein DDZ80_27250 [Cyanobacteria bacterium UBA8803]|nr:hypothetical protein [Cyanobacteria bacterium UBA9273]HBL61971.1 hypothetical protein [Cyanobacteria bacterium UBA8803]